MCQVDFENEYATIIFLLGLVITIDLGISQ